MKLFTLTDDLEYKECTRSYMRVKSTIFVCFWLLLWVPIAYLRGNMEGEKNADKVLIDTIHHNTTDTLRIVDEKFSHQAFADLLYAINVKYPHIVMAQAIIESGNFTSSIFKQNNNMFGMRLPRTRSTTAIGEKNGFACYSSWKDCVYDYALYQYSAMSSCKTEEEYYHRLGEKYAQDTAYVPALRRTIENQHLLSLFYE